MTSLDSSGSVRPACFKPGHADRAEDGRRSDCRHSANSLWERVDSCMTVGASIVVAYAGGHGEGKSLITGVKGSTEVGN